MTEGRPCLGTFCSFQQHPSGPGGAQSAMRQRRPAHGVERSVRYDMAGQGGFYGQHGKNSVHMNQLAT